MFAAEVRYRAAGDGEVSYCQPLKPSSAEAFMGIKPARLGLSLWGALTLLLFPDAADHASAAALGRPRLAGQSLPPPARLPCRELALEASGVFAGRHGDLGQSKGLGHDGIGAVALTLEVRPVTGCTRLNAVV